MRVAQKTRDTSQYDSGEGASSSCSEEEDNKYDSEQEEMYRIHYQFLEDLANDTPFHKILPLTPENQYGISKGRMTILHLLLSSKGPCCKLPIDQVRPLLDQLLSSDDKTVREFLSTKDANGVTALSLAVSEKKWDVLFYLLHHKEALIAAGVPSGEDSNNVLHEMVSKRSSRNSRLMEAPGANKGLHDCIELILSSNSKKLITGQNKQGFTPLHLAAKFKSRANLDGQVNLVSQLINACPESLKIADNEGKSPYRYRLGTPKTSSDGDDPIAFLMKDYYMHLDDRDEVVRHLYGKGGAGLSIEIDLSEHPVYEFSRASLENPSRHWKFENILRYVHFPEVHLEELPEDKNPTKDIEKKQGQRKSYDFNDEGIGRKDLKVIFDWLRDNFKVRKIIKVQVDDNLKAPHSDQIIEESLGGLGVEVLNWRKYDVCSETIRKAAPDVKEVYLYSSGNNAVLRSWSNGDGLAKLTKLKIVHIVIEQRLETYGRTKEMLRKFKGRLEEQRSDIRIEEKIERYISPKGNGLGDGSSSIEGSSPQQTHTWIEHMNDFVNFVINSSVAAGKARKIRVALIDNGVDGLDPRLDKIINLGTSYCSRPDCHGQLNSYWAPSRGHGTQMACLIHQVCPKVDLYVARIQDMEAKDTRQIDVGSVVKAINWAVDQNVDIISMSWTIKRTDENKAILSGALSKAIHRASNADILMFCSTDDQGKLGNNDIYPGRLPGTFKIGAARASGNEAEWTDESSHYTFPGVDLKQDISYRLKSGTSNLVSGSSLATALASGMAALLLYCIQITDDSDDPEGALGRARTHDSMDRAFDCMIDKSRHSRYIRAWKHLKPEFKDWEEEDGMDGLKKAMKELFN